MLTQSLTRPLVSPLTRAVTDGGGGGLRSAFMRSLAIIGDSRTEQGIKQFYAAASADWKGIDAAGGFTGVGITSTGSGTLEYRAADKFMRWTAPGDTAGPWTASVAGVFRLESTTADKFLDLRLRTASTLPATDQTVTVTLSGNLTLGWYARGFWKRALDYLRWTNTIPKVTGIGGSTTAGIIEQLPYIATQATGPGVDIFWGATNDVGGRVTTATTLANLATILDARRALGRTLVIVNEHARWDASAGTAMDAGQQASHVAINNYLAQYATDHGCIFVDAYAITYDSGFTDRRPLSGLLIDNVHLTDKGAQIIGAAIATAVAARIGYGPQRSWANNCLSFGDFAGSGGVPSTGATGTVATSWMVVREAGDTTSTCSVLARTDGITGQWQRVQFSGTTAGRIDVRPGADPSLATLGLAVGDNVYFEVEVDARSLVGVTNIQPFIQFTGSAAPALVSPSVKQSGVGVLQDGTFILRSPVFKLPAAMTALQFRVWIEHDVNASGDVRIGAAAIVKQ